MAGSPELGDGGYRYVVDRPNGQVSEYHYNASDRVDVVKHGTRNVDGSLNTDTVMRRQPYSDEPTQPGGGRHVPTWVYTDHPDIRGRKMQMGQTAIGEVTFDPQSGSTDTNFKRMPNGAWERNRTTADGWNRVNEEPFMTRKEPNGATLRRNLSGEIEQVTDANNLGIGIKRKDGVVSEVTFTPPGGKAPETLTSEDGKNWTRTFKDEAGQTKTETFAGTVTVSRDGVVSVNRGDGGSRTYRPDGGGVTVDGRTGDAVLTRPNNERLTVAFGVDGKPNKLTNADGSYRATDDGVTWKAYDKDGKVIPGRETKEKVDFNPATGTIRTEAADGSRVEITGGDGTFQRFEAVGQNKQLVLTAERNNRGEQITARFQNGVKQETEVKYPDNTVRRYGSQDLLTYMKDVNGKETRIDWSPPPGNPPVITSFTDENSRKWVREVDRDTGKPYYRVEGTNPPERGNFSVSVNMEGKLERLSRQSADIVGLDENRSTNLVREVRGLDGNIVSYIGEPGAAGITVRDGSGKLTRTIDSSGNVRQFEYNGTDKYGLPELSKIIVGEGAGFDSYERSRMYWTDNGRETVSQWKRASDGYVENGMWRLDQVTGDIMSLRNDFRREHYSLTRRPPGWQLVDDGGNLQHNGNEVKRISEKWRINYTFNSNGRFNEMNPRLENLSGDEILVMDNYLRNRGLDINEYIKNKWGDSAEGVILSGHMRRRGYTRDYHNAERANVVIEGAMAEMAENRVFSAGRTKLQLEQAVRESTGALSQKQLHILDKVHRTNHDGKSLSDSMREHPSWKGTTEIHKAAMDLYLTKGKENRTIEEQTKLIDMALSHVPNGFPPEWRDLSKLPVDPETGEPMGASAIQTQRLELFKEFAGQGRVDQKVRDHFAANGGDKKLEEGLVLPGFRQANGRYEYNNSMWKSNQDAGRMMTHARDYMRDGRLSASTQLEDDNWGTGTSNEKIKDIFKSMPPEEKARIRYGMDLRLALGDSSKNPAVAPAFGEDARRQAQALLDDPVKGKEAKAALAAYDEMARVSGQLAFFSNERHRLEYTSAAAGAEFNMEMGEKNISKMWWNSNKQNHMKTVEEMDRESYDLLTSDRALRNLNDQYMNTNFNYERGRAAADLLRAKLAFADAAKTKPESELRDIIPGARDLTKAQYEAVLAMRPIDKMVTRGQEIESMIGFGRELDAKIKAGEQVAKDISHGTKEAGRLNPQQMEALDLYNKSKENFKAPDNADAATRASLERQRESLALHRANAEEKLKEYLDRKDKEKSGSGPEIKPSSFESYKKAQEFGKGAEFAGMVRQGAELQLRIDEGKQIAERLGKLDPAGAHAARGRLSDEDKLRLSLYEQSKAGKLDDNQKFVLDLHARAQRTEGEKLSAQYAAGSRLDATLAAMDTPQKRAEARLKFTDEEKASYAAFQQMKSGEKLSKSIDEGRKLAEQIAAGTLKTESLEKTQKEQLASFRQYSEGRLSPAEAEALKNFRSKEAFDANKTGTKLDAAQAEQLDMQTRLAAYREDRTGVKAFFDGRELAIKLDAMPSGERQKELVKLEEDPARANEKHVLEAYRQTVYQGARDTVRRDFLEALEDNRSMWGNNYEGMFDAVANMKPEERRRYATDEAFRKQVDDSVKSVVSNESARKAVEYLLGQIKMNPEASPQKDVVFELLSKASTGKISPREAVSSLTEAFNGPRGAELRRKLDENDKANYDPNFAKAFNEAVLAHNRMHGQGGGEGQLTPEKFKERYVTPIIKDGHVSLETMRMLHLGSPEKIAADIMKMNEITRQHLLATEGDKLHTLNGVFSDNTRKFVETLLNQRGEIKVEDKLRAIYLGVLPAEDLQKTLGEIKDMKERIATVNEYSRKYGGHAVTDMKTKAGPVEYGRIESALRHREWTGYEHWENTRQHIERTDNWGTAWTWDSSRDRMKDSMGAFTRDFSAANMRNEEMDRNLIAKREGAAFDRAAGHVKSQEEMAEAASEALIAAAAAAVTIATAGAAGPLLIAAFTVGAAAAKIGVTYAIMGGNMNVNAAALGDLARRGAISGFTNIFGPAELGAIFNIGGRAAATASGNIVMHAAFEGMEAAVKAKVEREIAEALTQGLRQTVMGGMKEGAEQALVREAMEGLVKKGLISGEQALATRAVLQTAFKEAMESQAKHFIANEMKSLALSQASGVLGAMASTAADMFARGDLTMEGILDGSAFNHHNLSQLGEQFVHGLTGASGGHLAGRFTHHLVSPEKFGMMTHLTASGVTMVGSMAASNYLSNNLVATMKGTAWDGQGFSQTVINAGWAPFFQGVKGAYDMHVTPTGRHSMAAGVALDAPARKSSVEQVRGGTLEGPVPHTQKAVVDIQGTTLKDTQIHGKTVVVSDLPAKTPDGEPIKHTMTASGILEVGKNVGDLTVTVPKDQTLRVVVADPESARGMHIVGEGRVELYTPEGRPLPPELVSQLIPKLRSGQAEIMMLRPDGTYTRGNHDGTPKLWEPERNLQPHEIAKLRAELGDAAGKMTDAEVVNKFVDKVGARIEQWNDNAQQHIDQHSKTNAELQDAVVKVEATFGVRPGPDAEFNVAMLRARAGTDADALAIVEQYVQARTKNSEASKALNEVLNKRMTDVQAAINEFADAAGLPRIEIKRYGDVQAGAAAYRDGVIKIQTADLMNPRNLLEATYHEMTHAAQDQAILRLTHDELAKELGRKPTAEEVSQRYQKDTKHPVADETKAQWDKFVANALEGHVKPLEGADLTRATAMKKAFSESPTDIGMRSRDIQTDHNVVRRAKQFLNSEDGGQNLLHELARNDGEAKALSKHLFGTETPPKEIQDLIAKLPKQTDAQKAVSDQTIKTLVEKLAKGDADAKALSQRLFGADTPPQAVLDLATTPNPERAKHLMEGLVGLLKHDHADAAELSKLLFGTAKPPKEVLNSLAKPSKAVEVAAQKALGRLIEERFAKLDADLKSVYGDYVNPHHEKEALVTQNLARILAEARFQETPSPRVDMPAPKDGTTPQDGGNLAQWHRRDLAAEGYVKEALADRVAKAKGTVPREVTESFNHLAARLERGELDPQSMRPIADLMYQLGGQGKALTPEAIELLSRMAPDLVRKITDEVRASVIRRLAEALNAKAFDADSLRVALGDTVDLTRQLTAMGPTLDVVNYTRGHKTFADAEAFLRLPADHQTLLKDLFCDSSVQTSAIEAFSRRLNNDTTGNPHLDAALTPEVIARLTADQSTVGGQRHLRDLASVFADQIQGKINRPVEVLRHLAEGPGDLSGNYRRLISNKNLSDAQLLKMLNEIKAVPDKLAQGELAFALDRIASRPNAEAFLRSLDQVTDGTLRRYLTELTAADTSLTPELLGKLTEIHASSADMGHVANHILSAPSVPWTQKNRLINEIAAARLSPQDLAGVRTAIESGVLRPQRVSEFLMKPEHSLALELARAGKIADENTLFRLANDKDAHLLSEAVKRGFLDKESLAKVVENDFDSPGHSDHLRTVLRGELEGALTAGLTPAQMRTLITDPRQAFEAALKVEPRLHPDPIVAQAQRDVAFVRERLMPHLGVESRQDFSDFIRQKMANRESIESLDTQTRLSSLRELEEASRGRKTPLEPISGIVRSIVTGEGMSIRSLQIDALVRRPGGEITKSALDSLRSHSVGTGTVGRPGEPALLSVPGWKPVISEGRPLMENGKIVLENTGNVKVGERDLARFDTVRVFEVVRRNADGTVDLKLREPLRVAAHPDDILVQTINKQSVGDSNCVNCVRALLANLASLDLTSPASNGMIIPVIRQPEGHVRSFDYDTTGTISGSSFESYTVQDLRSLPQGVYRAETAGAFQSTATHSEYHTFVIVSPGGGNPPYVLDPSHGQRYPFAHHGTRLRLEPVIHEGGTPVRPAHEPPIDGAGQMAMWSRSADDPTWTRPQTGTVPPLSAGALAHQQALARAVGSPDSAGAILRVSADPLQRSYQLANLSEQIPSLASGTPPLRTVAVDLPTEAQPHVDRYLRGETTFAEMKRALDSKDNDPLPQLIAVIKQHNDTAPVPIAVRPFGDRMMMGDRADSLSKLAMKAKQEDGRILVIAGADDVDLSKVKIDGDLNEENAPSAGALGHVAGKADPNNQNAGKPDSTDSAQGGGANQQQNQQGQQPQLQRAALPDVKLDGVARSSDMPQFHQKPRALPGDPLDRTIAPAIGLRSSEVVGDALAFAARTDASIVDRTLLRSANTGDGGDGISSLRLPAADGTAPPADTTVEHLLNNPAEHARLDYHASMRELVGRAAFDNFMSFTPDRIAAADAMTRESFRRRIQAAGRSDESLTARLPGELAAERIATEATRFKLEQMAEQLISENHPVPAEISAELARLAEYTRELERNIAAIRPADVEQHRALDAYFASMREFMSETFAHTMRPSDIPQPPETVLHVPSEPLGLAYRNEHASHITLNDQTTHLQVTENVTAWREGGNTTWFLDSSHGHVIGDTVAGAFGLATVHAYRGAQVHGQDQSTVTLHDNSRGAFTHDSRATVRDYSVAVAEGSAVLFAGERAHLTLKEGTTATLTGHATASVIPGLTASPRVFAGEFTTVSVEPGQYSIGRHELPLVSLADKSVAVLHHAAEVTSRGPNTHVQVETAGSGTRVFMTEGSAEFKNASGSVTGSGVVRVSGDGHLAVTGEGAPLRVVVEGGNPKIDVTGTERVQVEVLAGKPVVEGPADVVSNGADVFSGTRQYVAIDSSDVHATLRSGTVTVGDRFALGADTRIATRAGEIRFDGGVAEVVVRTSIPPGQHMTPEMKARYDAEVQAHEVSKLFNDGEPRYAATIVKDVLVDGREAIGIVQQHTGTTLGKFLQEGGPVRPAGLHEALEHAIVERHILGENDFNTGNFTVSKRGAEITVSNIDMGKAFTMALLPNWGIGGVEPVFRTFGGKPLSESMKTKVEAFIAKLGDPAVREHLEASGLTDSQITAMKGRAKLLLAAGHPHVDGAPAMTPRTGAQGGDFAMFARRNDDFSELPPIRKLKTDYSSINSNMSEVRTVLADLVSRSIIADSQRVTLVKALGEHLELVEPAQVRVMGEKLSALAKSADFQQRAVELAGLLGDVKVKAGSLEMTKAIGVDLAKLLDPATPLKNLTAMREFLDSSAARQVIASGDWSAVARLRDNLNALVGKEEFAWRADMAKDMNGVFDAAGAVRFDFLMDARITKDQLEVFKKAFDALGKDDFEFAQREVAAVLSRSQPDAAKLLVEKLPELAKYFADPDTALDLTDAMRVIVDSSSTEHTLAGIKPVLEERAQQLKNPIVKEFVDAHLKAALELVLDQSRSDLLSPHSDFYFDQMQEVFAHQAMSDTFNEAIKNRFVSRMDQGRPLSADDRRWLVNHKLAIGTEQSLIERVSSYEAPAPKLMYEADGPTMVEAIKAIENYGDSFENFEHVGTTAKGNHLVKMTDEGGKRVNYLIVQPGKEQAVVFRVIDLEGQDLSTSPNLIKHLADFAPRDLDQIASGLYGDKSTRRAHLDFAIEVDRPTAGGGSETATARAYGVSWRVGGTVERTLLTVAKDSSGTPAIIVLERCLTKSAAAVDGSYNISPRLAQDRSHALRDLALPDLPLKGDMAMWGKTSDPFVPGNAGDFLRKSNPSDLGFAGARSMDAVIGVLRDHATARFADRAVGQLSDPSTSHAIAARILADPEVSWRFLTTAPADLVMSMPEGAIEGLKSGVTAAKLNLTTERDALGRMLDRTVDAVVAGRPLSDIDRHALREITERVAAHDPRAEAKLRALAMQDPSIMRAPLAADIAKFAALVPLSTDTAALNRIPVERYEHALSALRNLIDLPASDDAGVNSLRLNARNTYAEIATRLRAAELENTGTHTRFPEGVPVRLDGQEHNVHRLALDSAGEPHLFERDGSELPRAVMDEAAAQYLRRMAGEPIDGASILIEKFLELTARLHQGDQVLDATTDGGSAGDASTLRPQLEQRSREALQPPVAPENPSLSQAMEFTRQRIEYMEQTAVDHTEVDALRKQYHEGIRRVARTERGVNARLAQLEGFKATRALTAEEVTTFAKLQGDAAALRPAMAEAVAAEVARLNRRLNDTVAGENGGVTRAAVSEELVRLMDEPSRAFGGQSPRQAGYELLALPPTSGAAEIFGNRILINSRTGEFVPANLTSQVRTNMPKLRAENTIVADPKGPLGATHAPNSPELIAALKQDAGKQFTELLKRFEKNGSPLNVLDTPLHGLGAEGHPSAERLTGIDQLTGEGAKAQAVREWHDAARRLVDVYDLTIEDLKTRSAELASSPRTKDKADAASLKGLADYVSSQPRRQLTAFLTSELVPRRNALASVEVVAGKGNNGDLAMFKPDASGGATAPAEARPLPSMSSTDFARGEDSTFMVNVKNTRPLVGDYQAQRDFRAACEAYASSVRRRRAHEQIDWRLQTSPDLSTADHALAANIFHDVVVKRNNTDTVVITTPPREKSSNGDFAMWNGGDQTAGAAKLPTLSSFDYARGEDSTFVVKVANVRSLVGDPAAQREFTASCEAYASRLRRRRAHEQIDWRLDLPPGLSEADHSLAVGLFHLAVVKKSNTDTVLVTTPSREAVAAKSRQQGDMLMWKEADSELRIAGFNLAGRKLDLASGESIVLGRRHQSAAGNDAAAEHSNANLSQDHATLRRDGDRYILRDLDSAHGTFVRPDGRTEFVRVFGEVEIGAKDSVMLGGTAKVDMDDVAGKRSVDPAKRRGTELVIDRTAAGDMAMWAKESAVVEPKPTLSSFDYMTGEEATFHVKTGAVKSMVGDYAAQSEWRAACAEYAAQVRRRRAHETRDWKLELPAGLSDADHALAVGIFHQEVVRQHNTDTVIVTTPSREKAAALKLEAERARNHDFAMFARAAEVRVTGFEVGGESISLRPGESLVLGRSRQKALADADSPHLNNNVSREHALLIREEDGTYSVRDLESGQGTYLKRHGETEFTRITGKEIINPDDVVMLAGTGRANIDEQESGVRRNTDPAKRMGTELVIQREVVEPPAPPPPPAAGPGGRALAVSSGEVLSVGRNPEKNHVTADNANVSRRHLNLTRDEAGQHFIEDVGSTYGTFVRKVGETEFRRINGREAVGIGDVVMLGGTGLADAKVSKAEFSANAANRRGSEFRIDESMAPRTPRPAAEVQSVPHESPAELMRRPGLVDARVVADVKNDLPGRAVVNLGENRIPIDLPVGKEYVIGRKNGNVFEDSKGISRNHAAIGRDENGVYLRDLHSTNGTRVSASAEARPVAIEPGARVYLKDISYAELGSTGNLIEGHKFVAPERVRASIIPEVPGHRINNPDRAQLELAQGDLAMWCVGPTAIPVTSNTMCA